MSESCVHFVRSLRNLHVARTLKTYTLKYYYSRYTRRGAAARAATGETIAHRAATRPPTDQDHTTVHTTGGRTAARRTRFHVITMIQYYREAISAK